MKRKYNILLNIRRKQERAKKKEEKKVQMSNAKRLREWRQRQRDAAHGVNVDASTSYAPLPAPMDLDHPIPSSLNDNITVHEHNLQNFEVIMAEADSECMREMYTKYHPKELAEWRYIRETDLF